MLASLNLVLMISLSVDLRAGPACLLSCARTKGPQAAAIGGTAAYSHRRSGL